MIKGGTHQVKASALGYAISFLLMVALVCSGVLFIASINKRLERHHSMREHLVFDNYFSFQLAATKKDTGSFVLAHPSGDSSQYRISQWGMFRAIAVKTYHGKQSVQKAAIVGVKSSKTDWNIYLPNSNTSLKIGGDCQLDGTFHLPEKGIERAYLSGKPYKGEKLFDGNTVIAQKNLPALKKELSNLSLESFYPDLKKIDWMHKDSSFSFLEQGCLISSIEALNISQKIKGNVVLHSFDSIWIENTAQLEHVILIAPRIRFQKGFRGKVQAIAHESIICEEDVFLSYPSALVLNELAFNEKITANSIQMLQGAKVLGGALLVSQKPNFRRPLQFTMQKSLLAGMVYNEGECEIIGTIAGAVCTRQFFLRYGGGAFVNHLLDAKISDALLPESFIGPNWLEQTKQESSEILAWL